MFWIGLLVGILTPFVILLTVAVVTLLWNWGEIKLRIKYEIGRNL